MDRKRVLVADRAATGRRDLGLVLMLAAAVGYGLRPFFARFGYAEGLTAELAALVTLGGTALVLLPVTLRHVGWDRRPADTRPMIWAVLTGCFVGLGTLGYFRALAVIPVATATVIYFTFPLFTIILSAVFLAQRIVPRMLVACLLIIGGCALMLVPGSFDGIQLRAVALCFVLPVAYAVVMIMLAGPLTGLPLLVRTGLMTLGALLVLGPVTFAGEAQSFTMTSAAAWTGLAGLFVICGFVPQILTTIGVPLAGAGPASIASSAELVTAILVGWILLAETPGPLEMLGGFCVLAALLLVRRPRNGSAKR